MELNMQTVLHMEGFLFVVCTIVMLITWFQNRNRYHGIDLWVFQFGLISASTLLLGFQQSLPAWLSVITANGLLVAGFIMQVFGTLRFFDRKPGLPITAGLVLLFVAFIGIHLYFTFGNAAIIARILNISLFLAVLSGVNFSILQWNRDPVIKRYSGGVRAANLVLVILSILRIAGPALADIDILLSSGFYDTFMIMMFSIAGVFLAVNLIIMINGRNLTYVSESEIRYHTLFDTMLQGAVYQDINGEIILANRASEDILGLTTEQMKGKTSLDPGWRTIYEDGRDLPGEDHPSMQALRTGQPVRDVTMGVYNPRDDRYHWIVVNAIPLFQPDEDVPYQVYTTFTDVTQRHQADQEIRRINAELKVVQRELQSEFDQHIEAEKQRRQSEVEKTAILDSMTDMVSYLDADLNIIWANSVAATSFGFSPDQVIGKRCYQLRGESNGPCDKCSVIKAFQTGHVEVGERTVSNGSIWRVSACPVRDESGSITGVVEISTDITERKSAEQELALRARLLDQANDGICLISPNGTLVYVNETFGRLRGYHKEELLGKNIREIDSTLSDEQLRGIYKEMNRSGQTVFESVHQHRDGTPIKIEIHSRLVDIGGEPYNLSVERDITERDRVEQALNVSETNFRNSMDNSPIGIIIHRGFGQSLYANQAVLDLFGYADADELAETPADQRYMEADIPRMKARIQRLIDGETVTEKDTYFIRRKNGEYRYIEAIVSGVIWNGDNCVMVVYQDITERQQIDIERLALNRASRAVLTSTDFPSASREIFDHCREATGARNGFIAVYNESGQMDILFLENSGLDHDVNSSFPDSMGPLFKEVVRQHKTMYQNDIDWEHQEGVQGHLPVGNVLFTPFGIDGETAGVIGLANKPIGFTADDVSVMDSLSEICSIALVNSRNLEQITSSEEKYRLLFESIYDGFALHEMIYDDNGKAIDYRFLEVNPGFETLTGLKSENIIGKLVTEVLPGIDQEEADWIGTYAKVVETGEEARFDQHAETLDKWFAVLAYRNQPGQFATIFQDITKEKALEMEREKIAKLESIGLLAGGIAHDFNNILTGILGNVSLARMDIDQDSPLYQYLDDAEMASLRARDLTQQLLTFARGGEPIKKKVNIRNLLREAVVLGTRGSRTKPEFAIEDDIWVVEADEGQLNQVFLNLANNAVEASPSGGALQVSAVNQIVPANTSLPLAAGDYVRVTITDQGTGISPENLARIFEPYFSTKGKARGLGLATTFSIVKNHDGYISCRSTLGRGTSFDIYLPATRTAKQPEGEKSGTTDLITQARVLVMDDEPMILKLMERILTQAGCEVELTQNGPDAIQAYEAALQTDSPFSVVILDLTIPGGMSGEDTLDALLKIDPDVKAIVSSGYSTTATMANYVAKGFKGVIPKPYNPEQVYETLQKVLNQ